MANEISLDFSRFEARVHGIETRMLKMEAFLCLGLAAVFNNAAILAELEVQLGSEKACELVAGVHGYVAELQAQHGDGGG